MITSRTMRRLSRKKLTLLPSAWFHRTGTSRIRKPRPMREIKQLHIEREAFDLRRFKNRSARLEAKRFKSALRVPKRQSGGHPHQQIKNTAGLLSPPRLMHPDQATIQSARAKRDIHFAICDGFDQLRRLLKWRGKIGVGEKSDCCSCSK